MPWYMREKATKSGRITAAAHSAIRARASLTRVLSSSTRPAYTASDAAVWPDG
jgi:hypothetical protein